MLRKTDAKNVDDLILQDMYEQCVAQMMSDPDLTDADKQELLRQLELPDEQWAPIELPEGAESLSDTIIRMRRGN
jgi:hypothetical protein